MLPSAKMRFLFAATLVAASALSNLCPKGATQITVHEFFPGCTTCVTDKDFDGCPTIRYAVVPNLKGNGLVWGSDHSVTVNGATYHGVVLFVSSDSSASVERVLRDLPAGRKLVLSLSVKVWKELAGIINRYHEKVERLILKTARDESFEDAFKAFNCRYKPRNEVILRYIDRASAVGLKARYPWIAGYTAVIKTRNDNQALNAIFEI